MLQLATISWSSAQASGSIVAADAFDLYAGNLGTITSLAQCIKVASIPGPGGNNAGPVQLPSTNYRYLYANRTGGSTAGLNLVVVGQEDPSSGGSAPLDTGLSTYGGGEDGAAVFDGVHTFSFATITSPGVYQLTRDVFLSDGASVSASIRLRTGGYRIFCNGVCTNNGTISHNGNAAVGATAGASSSLGSLGIGTAGGNGRSNTTGLAGSGQSNGLQDAVTAGQCAGGRGGSGGANAGGAGGTYTANVAGNGGANYYFTDITGFICGQSSGGNQAQLYIVGGGSGGGGGGSDNIDTTGGGGGGAAGMMLLAIYNFINNGAVECMGGVGGNATGAHNGGGGGGGVILSTSRFRSGTAWNPATPFSWPTLTGGAPGAGVGTGVAGVAGAQGHVNVHWA